MPPSKNRLTNNTSLERDQYIRLPFRIRSKDSYYKFHDYFKSIPSLIIVLLYLIIKKRKYSIVFHGFPFQFIAPIFSSIQKNNIGVNKIIENKYTICELFCRKDFM